MRTPTLNIIGCGKLARSLGRLWSRHGIFSVHGLHSRSTRSAEVARDFIGEGEVVSLPDSLGSADAWLISTPDGAIADLAETLAQLAVVPPGACVFHCSGARSSELLAPLALAGATVASAHPVLSFAAPERVVENFAGTYCGLEGDDAACALLREAFGRIGARCFDIDPAHKLLYHAASVFAANFSVVLIDVASRAYRSAGLDEKTAMEVLAPLVEGAVGNALRVGPAAALTGPAARGDHDTITRQQACVRQWNATAGEAYDALTRLALELAERSRSR